jgi:hypothetical protein
MSFDDQLEELEIEAYRQLSIIPHSELTRELTERSGKPGATHTGATDAIGAVIDFREHRRSDALGWARGFAAQFLSEIRSQICVSSNSELGTLAGITPKTAASAVAVWIVGAFGVTNPVAFAMATLVVLVLARTLRTTFCTMTAEEVKLALQSRE